ncbi:hypothetical protein WJX73_000471 [Symbiochloris irregularis]|uniref:FAD-binding PCMH-type domain-containing protein n=1 Tax=Symbiochloris irregularis TaxID=706552 RepID=A0AAW1NVV2_9CHLO
MRSCAVAIACTAAVLLALRGADGTQCRQDPASATDFCGLPLRLANFQGYYACLNDVEVGRPQTKDDILDMISFYDNVKAVGVGHSWWKEQFCSSNDSTGVNIVMTELNTTLSLIENPWYPKPAPPDYPIQVNEATQTVTAQAGVPQRMLLDYLASYTTPSAPLGYILPAFPWYIDQSIGGAVATSSHGSSFWYGGLASQVVRIEMALSNATLANFSESSNAHLWHAAQVGVGRLGAMTEVELMIKPQSMIKRVGVNVTWTEFLEEIKQFQANWTGAVAGTNGLTKAEVLDVWEGTQLFWFVPSASTYKVQYFDQGQPPPDWEYDQNIGTVSTQSISDAQEVASSFAPASAPQPSAEGNAEALPPNGPEVSAITAAEGAGPDPVDVYAQVPTPELGPSALILLNPMLYDTIYKSFITSFFPNGTYTQREGILAETDFVNKQTTGTDPYDQYEVVIPLSQAYECLTKVSDAMYATGDANLTSGFVVPPLIRFLGAEDAYLSMSNGEPHIFFNLEDHLSDSTKKENKIMSIFVYECGARMHWGKAGWPLYEPCFDGSARYPDTWCDFGCAVQELDPTGKFSSISNVWEWQATQNGKPIPFASCCSTQGFDPSCTCATRTDCDATGPLTPTL